MRHRAFFLLEPEPWDGQQHGFPLWTGLLWFDETSRRGRQGRSRGGYHVIGRPQIDLFRLGIEDFEQIRRMVPLR